MAERSQLVRTLSGRRVQRRRTHAFGLGGRRRSGRSSRLDVLYRHLAPRPTCGGDASANCARGDAPTIWANMTEREGTFVVKLMGQKFKPAVADPQREFVIHLCRPRFFFLPLALRARSKIRLTSAVALGKTDFRSISECFLVLLCASATRAP